MDDSKLPPSTGCLVIRSLCLVIVAAVFADSYRIASLLRSIGCEGFRSTVIAAYVMMFIRLGVAVACVAMMRRQRGGGSLQEFALPRLREGFVATFVVVATAALLSAILFPGSLSGIWGGISESSLDEGVLPAISVVQSASFMIPFFVLSVIVAPVSEEIVFRAMAFSGVFGACRALSIGAISSIVFGLMHASEGVLHSVWATLWGSAMAGVFASRRRIWPLIAGHIIWNVIAEIPQWS